MSLMSEIIHYNFFTKTNEISRQSWKTPMTSKEGLPREFRSCSLQSSFSFTWISGEEAWQVWHLNTSFLGMESLTYDEVPLRKKHVFNLQMKESSYGFLNFLDTNSTEHLQISCEDPPNTHI